MKKLLLLSIVFVLTSLSLSSCSGDNDNEPVTQQEENPLLKKWYFTSLNIGDYQQEYKNYFTCAKDYIEFLPNGIQKGVYITGCYGGTTQTNEHEFTYTVDDNIITTTGNEENLFKIITLTDTKLAMMKLDGSEVIWNFTSIESEVPEGLINFNELEKKWYYSTSTVNEGGFEQEHTNEICGRDYTDFSLESGMVHEVDIYDCVDENTPLAHEYYYTYVITGRKIEFYNNQGQNISHATINELSADKFVVQIEYENYDLLITYTAD